ncbi:uncharacterized protein CDV56_105778 [Aspergillus thermomutatus]|uniref:Secreted protein CSS2 C-terminal domain-containing protein n=1 Tax=Aspergillus thermomutatus TaxID=41047 RepID=A0A397GHA5_ASPTH|nr:uncharacterized protein CDV56_105778 [Aspergillus thermomutatus]RHZ49224.1 hypothetical protein CDV56_105778 [Aspergillus thermomutatus]
MALSTYHQPADTPLPVKEQSMTTADTESLSSSTAPEDGSQYPRKLKLFAIVSSLNLAMFLIGLDNTIISTAIPKITDRFHALDDVGWRMVSERKIVSDLLAFGVIDGCLANDNVTTVTYTPITEAWAGLGTNLTVTFDIVSDDYLSLYTNSSLEKRTANAGLEIYEDIAAMIKSKSNQNSCSLVYGTDSDGTYVEGYAYEATTSGENCDTTAEKKTIIAAVEKCANKLNGQGAIRGCCTMNHGGTWTGHLRLTASPSLYPAHTVTY